MTDADFEVVHELIQRHMFPLGRGNGPVLLDWPDELGQVNMRNEFVSVLRAHLNTQRNRRSVESPAVRVYPESFWPFEAAFRSQAEWDRKYKDEPDQPIAPWQLSYLAAIIGAWRDNLSESENQNAVWPAIHRGLGSDSTGPSHFPVQELWTNLFKGLANWSARPEKSDGRFLFREMGKLPYVKFVLAQRVATPADIRTLARWLFDVVNPDDKDLLEAIDSVSRREGFEQDSLQDLKNPRSDTEKQLLLYLLMLVTEELRDMRKKMFDRLDASSGTGDTTSHRLTLRCTVWKDADNWRHCYQPSSPCASISFNAYSARESTMHRFSVNDGQEAFIDGRRIELADLRDCQLEARKYFLWANPDDNNPIVLQPQYDEWLEVSRGSALNPQGDYLVFTGSMFRQWIGQAILDQPWGFSASQTTWLVPGTGVSLGHSVYHSLALPRLRDDVVVSGTVNVRVDGSNLVAEDLTTARKLSARLSVGAMQQTFDIHNPCMTSALSLEDDHNLDPEDGAAVLNGTWQPEPNFQLPSNCIGLLQILSNVGARSRNWVNRVQREHFSDDPSQASTFVWNLRRLGHVVAHSSDETDVRRHLRARSAELVLMPLLKTEDGKPVFWLRGSFDWCRLSSFQISGASWSIDDSGRGGPPRIAVTAELDELRHFCRRVGARMVDPRKQLAHLSSHIRTDFARERPSQSILPENGNWQVFLPFQPDSSVTKVYPSAAADWELGAVFGDGFILAKRPGNDEEAALDAVYSLLRVVGGSMSVVRRLSEWEFNRLKGEAIRWFWEHRLAPSLGCYHRPAAYMTAAPFSLLEPKGSFWPIEICAALSAFSGVLPKAIPASQLPGSACQLHRALQDEERPKWVSQTRVAPMCNAFWRFVHVPASCSTLACEKLGWTTMETL